MSGEVYVVACSLCLIIGFRLIASVLESKTAHEKLHQKGKKNEIKPKENPLRVNKKFIFFLQKSKEERERELESGIVRAIAVGFCEFSDGVCYRFIDSCCVFWTANSLALFVLLLFKTILEIYTRVGASILNKHTYSLELDNLLPLFVLHNPKGSQNNGSSLGRRNWSLISLRSIYRVIALDLDLYLCISPCLSGDLLTVVDSLGQSFGPLLLPVACCGGSHVTFNDNCGLTTHFSQW